VRLKHFRKFCSRSHQPKAGATIRERRPCTPPERPHYFLKCRRAEPELLCPDETHAGSPHPAGCVDLNAVLSGHIDSGSAFEHFLNTCKLLDSIEWWCFLKKSHLSVCFSFTPIPKMLYGIRRSGDRDGSQLTGWPEVVTRLRLPRNVACGFPALRSSEVNSQHGDGLQLLVRKIQPWLLRREPCIDLLELLPPNRPFRTPTAQHFAPAVLHGSMHPLHCTKIPSDAIVCAE